jgi:hypothetical protein
MPPMNRPRRSLPAADDSLATAAPARVPVRVPAGARIAVLIGVLIGGGALAALGASPAPASQSTRPSQPAPPAPPTKDALALSEEIRARWMGVDHVGNLWAWEPLEGSVRFFSPAAERLGTVVVPLGAAAVDGDVEWGAVALTAPSLPGGADGKLAWVRPGAAPGKHEELALPEPASWVCWIDRDTIALSPQRAGHRVEVWSLATRKLLKSFGAEPPIALATGATRVREVLLRYDGSRRLLFTLESFTGSLEVFSLDGKLAWSAKLEDPYRQVEEKTLADLDERARSRAMKLGQSLSALWLAEGPDGSAWVSQQIDMLHGAVTLMKVSAAGTAREQVADLRCPSRTFTIWGGQLVFFRDIPSPREVCNSVVPLP